MLISVICPIYNEEKYIEKCINSILEQDYPKDDLEVLFVDGMSKDKTRDIIKVFSLEYPFIKLLDNPDKYVPQAMNKGIKESKGEIVIRIDAHSSYPYNYVSYLVENLINLDADNVGVVAKTDVLNKTPKSIAIREVLSNKFGVGNSHFRTGTDKIMEVDTVPFGCYRKDIFDKYGMYDERLIRNQDIELNKRMKKNGAKVYLLPGPFCTYYARETYKPFIRNNYQNGLWNILVLKYTNDFASLSLRHFIPLFFLLSLVVPTLLSLLWSPLIYISIMSILLYTALVVFISVKSYFKSGVNPFYMIATFFLLHLSYGMGSLVGLVKVLFNRV